MTLQQKGWEYAQKLSDQQKIAKIAYLAGFFDGEGSIGIFANKSRSSIPNPWFTMRITATQVDPSPLYLFKETFGGFLHTKKYQGKNQRIIHMWGAGQRIALRALEEMLPYLIVKRTQAELAIEFQRLLIRPRGHVSLTTEEVEQRFWYKSEISRLKWLEAERTND